MLRIGLAECSKHLNNNYQEHPDTKKNKNETKENILATESKNKDDTKKSTTSKLKKTTIQVIKEQHSDKKQHSDNPLAPPGATGVLRSVSKSAWGM